MAFFDQLTERFYERVAGDELLRPLYPDDLGPPRRRLCLFLAQFWGGPRLYEDQRGAPRLRARHLRWEIGPAERDRWLQHMLAALEASPAGRLERAQLWGHFQAVANHLVNADGPRAAGAGQSDRAGASGTVQAASTDQAASTADPSDADPSDADPSPSDADLATPPAGGRASAGLVLRLQPPAAGRR